MTASLCDYLFTNHENGTQNKENVTQNKEILPFIRPICRKVKQYYRINKNLTELFCIFFK